MRKERWKGEVSSCRPCHLSQNGARLLGPLFNYDILKKPRKRISRTSRTSLAQLRGQNSIKNAFPNYLTVRLRPFAQFARFLCEKNCCLGLRWPVYRHRAGCLVCLFPTNKKPLRNLGENEKRWGPLFVLVKACAGGFARDGSHR